MINSAQRLQKTRAFLFEKHVVQSSKYYLAHKLMSAILAERDSFNNKPLFLRKRPSIEKTSEHHQ